MRSILNWLKSEKTKQTPMEAKDPMDWRLTHNSTEWTTDIHWCPTCKKKLGHEEFMANVCDRCGGFFSILSLRSRSYRKIWNGSRWVWQYKYANGEKDYEIVEERY